jgi:Bacterial regulatory helix-turn-helix protein, lysR family
MELSNLNLNLLAHLDALLAQQNVSGAAEQLNLSQPTVSSALSRLRRHFGDDLFPPLAFMCHLKDDVSATGSWGRQGSVRGTGVISA